MATAFDESRQVFGDAARWFLDTVAQVGHRWDEPALGEWNVRDLVGHTSRSFLTVEAYLDQPAGRVEVAGPADYLRATREIAAGPGVAERGRQAGAALGAEPAGAVAAIAARVILLVDQRTGSELVTTIVGGMRLADYLPTRTFELVVHTADLAATLGLPTDPPATAARQALALVTELAVESGQAGSLLLAATGRGAAAGLTVL